MDHSRRFGTYVKSINDALNACIESDSKVSQAMRYSLLSGGKRIRGSLVLAICDILGGEYDAALNAACAVEMLHCYSLIHDDLPCMDNDDFRRGMPSCHKKYGEATALLAGDGLLTEAFRQLSTISKPQIAVDCISLLSFAAGYKGMILGQELDLQGIDLDREVSSQLDRINNNKTGKLITCSVLMGAACSGCTDSVTHEILKEYGDTIGLVFQIIDDVLDVTSSLEILGKNTGSDIQNNKITYCSVYGIEESRKIAADLNEKCMIKIRTIDKSGYLEWFAKTMLNRNK